MYWATSHTHCHGNNYRNDQWGPKVNSCSFWSIGVFISRWRNNRDEFIMSSLGWHLPRCDTPCHWNTVPSIGYEPSTWGGNGNHSLLLRRYKPIVESSQGLCINPCTLFSTLKKMDNLLKICAARIQSFRCQEESEENKYRSTCSGWVLWRTACSSCIHGRL